MGYGGCVMGTSGKDLRISALYKIWEKYGREKFKHSDLKKILTKCEAEITNLNGWKHRNLVKHDGNFVERGKTVRFWKLTGYSVEICKKIGV